MNWQQQQQQRTTQAAAEPEPRAPEQTLWRQARDAAHSPPPSSLVLAAPLRRLPRQPGLSVSGLSQLINASETGAVSCLTSALGCSRASKHLQPVACLKLLVICGRERKRARREKSSFAKFCEGKMVKA
ncbi:uncharacterized protein LOC144455840 [Phascolarctos cinereus]